MRILVVDDDEFVRDAVGSMLTQAGHPIQKASSAQRAFEILKARLPDLLITDIRMPGQTGLELCIAVRNLYPDLPVIGMSGHFVDDPGEELFDGFLQKPFQMSDLIDKVEEIRSSRVWTAEMKS